MVSQLESVGSQKKKPLCINHFNSIEIQIILHLEKTNVDQTFCGSAWHIYM